MARKHTHKYHKVQTDVGPVWACGLPDCNHFMPPHYTKLIPGKSSICWDCGEEMVLTSFNMKDNQPKCPDCAGLPELAAIINEKIGS